MALTIDPKTNPDLTEEREKVEFNVEEFTNWFYGGEDKVQEKRFLENFFLETPELKDKSKIGYMSHKELYEDGIRRTAIVLKKLNELESQGFAKPDLRSDILAGLFQKAIFPEGSPLSVHYDMFIPGLRSMGTEEQQKKWIDKAYNCEIIGAYAQTELGHGTNIRGLETTATFDPKTKEFVFNSPTITAYKWWPGGLGHTANHAIVMAQLWSLGKCHGVHPFFVQLRAFDTHKPMRGIIIGEIGSKLGFNTVNNGYLGFDNYRIPRDQMLMKNSEILENGEYQKKKSSILAYGTMTYIRVGILNKCLRLLAQATIIVTRYSIVRRQSPINPDEPEPKIIDHVTQQQKIFPQIAKVIVFNLASKKLKSFYDEVMAELEKGKLNRLPELHALSCCLKAVSSTEATDGIQALRLACGGHGYLNSAGINALFKTATAAQTYEGENTVLLLQTARYLMKVWKQAMNKEKLPPTVAYLSDFVGKSELCGSWDASPYGVVKGFQATAAGKIRKAYENFAEKQKTMSLPEAMNRCGIEMTKAAELHCQVFLIETAIHMVHDSFKNVSPAICYLLRDILEMFAVDVSYRYLGDLQQHVRMTSKDMEILQLRREFCLQKVRQNAIGIVDGFDYPDEFLNSTLGAYDGNVYERLLDAAKASPLNQEDVNRSFELYLKPFMKSNL